MQGYDTLYQLDVQDRYIRELQDWASNCEKVARENFELAQKVREFYGLGYKFKAPAQKYVGQEMPKIADLVANSSDEASDEMI